MAQTKSPQQIDRASLEVHAPIPSTVNATPSDCGRAMSRGLTLPETTLEAERQWCLLARSVLRQYQHRHHPGMLAAVPGPSRLWDAYDHLAAQLTALLEAWPEEGTDG